MGENGTAVKERTYQEVARGLLEALREEYAQSRDDTSAAADSKRLDLVCRTLLGNGNVEESVVFQLLVMRQWIDRFEEREKCRAEDIRRVLVPLVVLALSSGLAATFWVVVTQWIK